MLEAGELVFSELKNIVVWVKSNGGQGSFYRSQHELICVFKKGKAAHANSFELGQHGRTRTNVWPYAGVNSFKAGRQEELDVHPTVKPVRLVADAMLDCSRRGSIVLDPFMGSGTTIIAGQTVGRRVYGMELEPRYVDVAVRRWERFSGRDATLEATGQTFAEVEAARNEGGRIEEKSATKILVGEDADAQAAISMLCRATIAWERADRPRRHNGSPVRAVIQRGDRRARRMPPRWRKPRWAAKSSSPSMASKER